MLVVLLITLLLGGATFICPRLLWMYETTMELLCALRCS
jgi:hypothetical protein